MRPIDLYECIDGSFATAGDLTLSDLAALPLTAAWKAARERGCDVVLDAAGRVVRLVGRMGPWAGPAASGEA